MKTFTDEELIAHGFANRNHFSGRLYKGIKNQILLNKLGYDSKDWLTFKQAKFNSLKIKPGEKAARICYQEFKDQKQEDGTYMKIPVTTYHLVFNLQQTEPMEKYERA